MSSDDVSKHVVLKEDIGTFFIKLEGCTAFGVENKAISSLRIDFANLTRVKKLLLVGRVRPEDLPGYKCLFVRLTDNTLHLGYLLNGLGCVWNASVTTKDGIIKECTNGQAVKDSVGYLPNLQTIRFTVLEYAFFVV